MENQNKDTQSKQIKGIKSNAFLQGYYGSQVIGKFGAVPSSINYPYFESVQRRVPENQVTLKKVTNEYTDGYSPTIVSTE